MGHQILMDTGNFWLTYEGFWMRLWGTTRLLKNYPITTYFIFIFLKIFIIIFMNKRTTSNCPVCGICELNIQFKLSHETLSPTLRYITQHMLCYINECYINENMLFSSGFLFFHWKCYMFYSCYWMSILSLHLSSSYLFYYWSILEYIKIFNCYKCWCYTYCYILCTKLSLAYIWKWNCFSHRIYYALMNCADVISINNMEGMSNSIDSYISEK